MRQVENANLVGARASSPRSLDILLVTPINRSLVISPSIGLGYLAAVARVRGHRVSILHCGRERMRWRGWERLLASRFFDLIGFQVYSYDLPSVKRHLEAVRRRSPRTITIAGGAHPSGDPIGTFTYLDSLDYAFCGEAEESFPLLLDRLSRGDRDPKSIPGLVFRDGGAVRVSGRGFIDTLDSLPLPAWDLLEPERFPEAPHGAFTRAFPVAPMIVTRGCPCRCTFCAGSMVTSGRFRSRSLDSVMEEVSVLRRRGIREIHIEDENFTLRKAFVVEFCERLLRDHPGLSWSLPSGVRIDTLDREMLELMQRSGCYSLALGIEFGTQRMHDVTRKGLTLEVIRDKLEIISGLKIKTTGFFLLGVPGETLEQMAATVDFALSLPLDRAQFNNYIPLPGSELGDRVLGTRNDGMVPWEDFYVHAVAYADPGIAPARIKRLQRAAYLKFYLRARTLGSLLREIRSLRHFFHLGRRLADSIW